MKYKGVSAQRRKQLAHLLAAGKGGITIDFAAQTLNLEREKARALLSSFNRSGWLKMIKPGLYVGVPIESEESDLTDENALVIASYLYSNCYIGGWSAASHWDLTDQIFHKTWVMTASPIKKKQDVVGRNSYLLRHVPETYLFGLHPMWIKQDKVWISDPHKTVIDFANFITDFGLQALTDVFLHYLRSEKRDFDVLLHYAQKSMNRTVFKRIGFMLEKYEPTELIHINRCLKFISKGPSKLSPNVLCDVYIKKWHLNIPKSQMIQ